ncbi:uncharacterized protein LOC130999931 [Salvia miltiorrhiza]|uniref:uncharacterized protein LOC130999931 n=1 Tax=Salvia miltiorrhiza TaxID=226208 RepID=UPI0025ABF957|nr:uncharacterized protein LOC130999931 [Salvia miltiorrhiza]
MASSLPISLLLHTLLLFAVPISSYPLGSICKQAKNPNFCYNLLQPHANANLQDLDQFVIDATAASAAKTSSKIQSLLPQTSDPNLKVVYTFCSNYYSAALGALAAAREKLRARAFRDVKSAADTVSGDADACRKAFAMAPSQPIAIAGDNNEFELLSNVFVVVSGKL